jgi:hypothetical protein
MRQVSFTMMKYGSIMKSLWIFRRDLTRAEDINRFDNRAHDDTLTLLELSSLTVLWICESKIGSSTLLAHMDPGRASQTWFVPEIGLTIPAPPVLSSCTGISQVSRREIAIVARDCEVLRRFPVIKNYSMKSAIAS